MPARPLRDDEKPEPREEPPSDNATYGPTGREATYRGKPLNEETANDADDHQSA